MAQLPAFDEFMLPILKLLRDEKVWGLSELRRELASQFQLNEEQLRALLPSGTQTVFDSRIGWARTYLKKACLIEATSRAHFRITDRGLQHLNGGPARIGKDDLMQYEEFREFVARASDQPGDEQKDVRGQDHDQSPEEALSSAYASLRGIVESELLERLRSCDPLDFERYVVDVLLAMGYGGSREDAGRVTAASGDGGIDGIIKEDTLGLDLIYVQAKRWENSVSRPELQKFAGALQGKRAKKGVFITTSEFTREGKDFANSIDSRIILIDGRLLARLMFQYDVGVSPAERYVVKKIDEDYFLDS